LHDVVNLLLPEVFTVMLSPDRARYDQVARARAYGIADACLDWIAIEKQSALASVLLPQCLSALSSTLTLAASRVVDERAASFIEVFK
jgi:hypothetical protein